MSAPYPEIAQTRPPTNTVKTRMFHARKKLAQLLAQRGHAVPAATSRESPSCRHPLTTDAPPLDPHEAATLLLPWYANGTLSPEETRQVKRILTNVPTVAPNWNNTGYSASRFGSNPNGLWQPPSGHFERLMADIDRLDTGGPSSVPSRRHGNA